MRICFVADFRSPIAQQWIEWVSCAGHEVHVICSRPFATVVRNGITVDVEPLGPVAALHSLQRAQGGTSPTAWSLLRAGKSRMSGAMGSAARRVAPAELRLHARSLERKIIAARPDLVHAMRLPYEAMAVSQRRVRVPWVASIWGNDLTLHAGSTPGMSRATRRTLGAVDALHTDCVRDLILSEKWGFDLRKPSLVVPGSGGVRMDLFRPGSSAVRAELGIPSDAPLVINPRGVRTYVRLPEFMDAADRVLCRNERVHFVALGIGSATTQRWRGLMSHADRFHILPEVPHSAMPAYYRAADVTLSLTSHDGTPNSLLEAMSSGCFPIVGPVESVLEWVTHGVNGFVADPRDPQAVADAIINAIEDRGLREAAASANRVTIERRAELESSMSRAIKFYEQTARLR